MTGIQWTEEVWNPTTGCDRISPGCDHCYALTMAKRLKGMGQAKYQNDGDPKTSGPGFGLTVHPDALTLPLRWRKPRKIFVNSMSDLFHADVPTEFIAQVFAVMAACPQHTFQVLTKRHGRMRSLLNSDAFLETSVMAGLMEEWPVAEDCPWPLPNVWLGVSVEDQHWADIRVPALIETPAAVRWLSCEPLIGELALDVLYDHAPGAVTEFGTLCMCGTAMKDDGIGCYGDRIGWIVAGGESGPGARPCDLEWLRSLRRQCEEGGVPFFCKQVGAVAGREIGAGAHGADWDAWPEDLRIRQFPVAAEAVPAS